MIRYKNIQQHFRPADQNLRLGDLDAKVKTFIADLSREEQLRVLRFLIVQYRTYIQQIRELGAECCEYPDGCIDRLYSAMQGFRNLAYPDRIDDAIWRMQDSPTEKLDY